MQKILSARIDESVFDLVDRIAVKKKMSKPKIIEEAIKYFGELVLVETDVNPFEASFGAWDRDESAEETVQRAKQVFDQV